LLRIGKVILLPRQSTFKPFVTDFSTSIAFPYLSFSEHVYFILSPGVLISGVETKSDILQIDFSTLGSVAIRFAYTVE